jgi:hypothetical protein
MPDLRLAKLPDRTPVKVTINVSPDLHRSLDDYAALYAESYGTPETVVELIPAMVAAFIEGDKGFARRRRSRGQGNDRGS